MAHGPGDLVHPAAYEDIPVLHKGLPDGLVAIEHHHQLRAQVHMEDIPQGRAVARQHLVQLAAQEGHAPDHGQAPHPRGQVGGLAPVVDDEQEGDDEDEEGGKVVAE